MTKQELLNRYIAYYSRAPKGPKTKGSGGSYKSYLNVLPFWEIDNILGDWFVVKVENSKFYETFDPANKGKNHSTWNTNQVECNEWNFELFKYYRNYISGKNTIINSAKKKTQNNLNLQYDYLQYIADFLDVNDMVYALSVLDAVEGINQKAINHSKATGISTTNLDNSRSALLLLREWIEFGKTGGTLCFVQNVKSSSVPATANLLSKLRRQFNKPFIHKIDGAIALVREIGVDNFIQYAIDQSYFFEPNLVNDRMDKIVTLYSNRLYLYARKSTMTTASGGDYGQDDDGLTPSVFITNVTRDNAHRSALGKNIKPLSVTSKTIHRFFTDKNPISSVIDYPIIIDTDGNEELRSVINVDYTGYTVGAGKGNIFQNYRISHIWGRAFDPRFFTNLWNVVLVPAWANDLLDKTNPVQGTLASKLQSTFMMICIKLYFGMPFNWKALNILQPSVINDGKDIVVPKKSNKISETIYTNDLSKENIIGNRNQGKLPYLINVIKARRSGDKVGDIVKYVVY